MVKQTADQTHDLSYDRNHYSMRPFFSEKRLDVWFEEELVAISSL